MDISIEEVASSGQFNEFVNFPHRLLSSCPLWVPPLKKDEKKLLSTDHPFWKTACRKLFLARVEGRTVGRIAAIIDYKYNEYAKVHCGAFGFFECEENAKAAHGLLHKAYDWLAEQKMDFMRGPLSPSTNYTCGTLVSGFELAPCLMMPWNPPYYPRLLESWRMLKERDLFAYAIYRRALELPDWLKNELAMVKAEGRFWSRSSSKASMPEDVKAMLQIYRESWADNWGFSPLSQEEAELLVKELTAILDPDFFILFFEQDQPVAGMVALPDLNSLLKCLKGSLGPLLPWHYWRSRKSIRKGYRIMLFGILPAYRMYGLPMLLLDEMLSLARKRPELEWVEGSWVLEDNAAIDQLIEDFGGRISKRYRIYRRDISPCPKKMP